MSSMRVRVQGKYSSDGMAGHQEYGPYLNWPRICPCCGENLVKGVKRPLSGSQRYGNQIHTLTWQIPYCEGCNKHIGSLSKFWSISIGTFLAWVVLGAYLMGSPQSEKQLILTIYILGSFLIPTLAILFFFLLKRKLLGRNCTSMREPIVYKNLEGGLHTILFKNGKYAELFAKANNGLLDPTPASEAPFF